MRRTRTDYAIKFILIDGIATILSILNNDVKGLEAILVLFIFCGAILQTYLATGRLKDMNANPWWAILTILPFVGFILMFPKGTQGTNQYGEDPRTLKKG